MTKAENSRVAQSNEPSADRIAADLSLAGELARMTAMFQQRAIVTHMGFNPDTLSPGAGNALSSANLGGGDNDKPAAPVCYSCGHAICDCPDHVWASRTVVVDTRSDAGSYAAHIRDTACMGATL